MTQKQQDTVQFPAFKEWVPEKWRFGFYLLFLSIFQFANGFYFPAMSQVSGELSATRNDTLMMGYSVLVGLTLFFPLAFRLKFRFTNRTSMLIAATVLLLCNIAVPYIHSTPLLIVICFIGGFFHLYGVFECLSNILPKITPSFNYAVFLSFVFFLVIGCIQVFDIFTTYIIYWYNWKYVHYLVIMLLFLLIAMVIVFMRPFREMPKLPLYGIDWLGFLLWAVFLLSLIFTAQYGQQMHWFTSPYIRFSIGIALLALSANLWRMTHIRHPYLEIQSFASKNLWYLLILFFLMDVLLSAQTVLQGVFTSEILHYDQLTEASLKWFTFIGVGIGALFSYISLTKFKIRHKIIMFTGMAFIVLYLFITYFLISPDTGIEKLYIPLIFSGFGQVLIFISLTVYVKATVPFKNYFQVICILGFIRTGIASPIGGAIYTHTLNGFMTKNRATIDLGLNTITQNSVPTAYSEMTTQALINSLQQLFGWSFICGIIILMAILSARFKSNISHSVPTLQKKYKLFAKGVKMFHVEKQKEAAFGV